MKQIVKNLYGYVCFITEPKPINLLCTFCRLFVYCTIVIDFITKEYILGFLILVIQLISTYMTISRYRYKCLGKEDFIYRFFTRKSQKDFQKKILRSKNEFIKQEQLSLEEEIKAQEEFIGVMNLIIKEAEKELAELKNKKDGENK